MIEFIKEFLIVIVGGSLGIIGIILLIAVAVPVIVIVLSPLLIVAAWLDFNGYKKSARTAKLPLSTIEPLLNDSDIIEANRDYIKLRDGRYWDDSIYIKLNLIDYLKYQWYIRSKHHRKTKKANFDNTMAAVNRLNIEYDRINQEVQKMVDKETDNVVQIAERLKEVK